jgi:hypothetical protein
VVPIGAHVRISRIKRDFEKGYTPNWSTEKFIVRAHRPEFGRTLYKLEDTGGEEVAGTFYREEIQPVAKDSKDTFYDVEEILETRTVGRQKQHLVKYVGLPNKFNRWVSAKDVKKLV